MNKLDIKETQIAIKLIKDYFERELSNRLNLIRVSAPLFVKADTGLNDNLTGIERPVSFNMRRYNQPLEIVQSLAKWKRMALKRYDFSIGEGIYADMDAIRPDEKLSPIHSIYVDQWDWEKVISKGDRNEEYLKYTVKIIFDVFKRTEEIINDAYPFLKNKLPDDITFITTQELEDIYPDYSPEERERFIVREHKAVFLMKIGDELKSGVPHDKRAPDYDDWELNGDILFWNPILEDVIELSSMGIRVDKESLKRQMKIARREEDMVLPYHKMLINDELPQTIGGGIGQSRICMFLLEKEHIGQVQASVWTDDIVEECKKNNIFLL